MCPVERAILLEQFEHEAGLHAVAISEYTLLQVRNDRVKDSRGQPLILNECRNETSIRSGRKHFPCQQFGVDRTVVENHAAHHPQEILVGRRSVLLKQL